MWHLIEERVSVLLQRIAAWVLLPVLVVVVAADVVARYVFSHSLQWAQDVSTLAMLTLFIAAIPLVTRRGGHIRVEIAHSRFGPRTRALADALGDLSGLAFMGLLAWEQLAEVPQMFARGDGAENVDIPHWPIALFIGACSALVCAMLLASALRSLRTAWRMGAAKEAA